MSFEGRETIPYSNPKTPFISDEEVQHLRDLWRPSIQETWRPLVYRDPQTGEMKDRDADFDTTKVSLWVSHPLYVIPPAIAAPLSEKLSEEIGGPMFESTPDHQEDELRGATNFMQMFLWMNSIVGFTDYSRGDARANFDHNGDPGRFLTTGFDTHPSVSVMAPLLERRIDYKEVPAFRDYAYADTLRRVERQQREGILGWTIPLSDKETGTHTRSMLRAKNHLVEVGWFLQPLERLQLDFKYAQLSREGGAMLTEQVAELEHLLPTGTDYDTLYNYHERVAYGGYSNDGWRDTGEDRKKRQQEYDTARRDWLNARPRAY